MRSSLLPLHLLRLNARRYSGLRGPIATVAACGGAQIRAHFSLFVCGDVMRPVSSVGVSAHESDTRRAICAMDDRGGGVAGRVSRVPREPTQERRERAARDVCLPTHVQRCARVCLFERAMFTCEKTKATQGSSRGLVARRVGEPKSGGPSRDSLLLPVLCRTCVLVAVAFRCGATIAASPSRSVSTAG